MIELKDHPNKTGLQIASILRHVGKWFHVFADAIHIANESGLHLIPNLDKVETIVSAVEKVDTIIEGEKTKPSDLGTDQQKDFKTMRLFSESYNIS